MLFFFALDSCILCWKFVCAGEIFWGAIFAAWVVSFKGGLALGKLKRLILLLIVLDSQPSQIECLAEPCARRSIQKFLLLRLPPSRTLWTFQKPFLLDKKANLFYERKLQWFTKCFSVRSKYKWDSEHVKDQRKIVYDDAKVYRVNGGAFEGEPWTWEKVPRGNAKNTDLQQLDRQRCQGQIFAAQLDHTQITSQ